MLIDKYSTKEVVTISEEASLDEVATLMKNNNVGAVVVVKETEEGKKPVGIITDRDIVMNLAESTVSLEIDVKDAISQDFLSIKEDQEVEEVIEAIVEKGVRRAPIVNSEGEIKGIITLDDLFVALINKLHNLSHVIKQQIE